MHSKGLLSWKPSLKPVPLFHTPSNKAISILQLAICVLFLPQSNKALEDDFLQNGHFPLHRWGNSIVYWTCSIRVCSIQLSHAFLKIGCLSGIVKKIDHFTAEAYSQLSHHKGSKVFGGVATFVAGGRWIIWLGIPFPWWIRPPKNPKSITFGSAKFEWWIWQVSPSWLLGTPSGPSKLT